MDYVRESIERDDWKKVINDGELDKVITPMRTSTRSMHAPG